jgi:hypothetical protein
MNVNAAYGGTILEKNAYNGRVDVLSNETVAGKIAMFEKIATNNKAASYCDALKGQWEDNVISQVFFCKENVQIIQNAIRAEVYQKSGNKYMLAPPGMDHLMIVMRSTFLNYVEYQMENITKQVERLNRIVIDWCVKELYSASQAYVNYLEDQSSIYHTIPRPLNHDREYKQLQLKDWV